MKLTHFLQRSIGLVLALLFTLEVEGATGRRFLLVVDRNPAMKPVDTMTQFMVLDLISTGFNHSMQEGDILECWVYNTQVASREFPPILWTPAKSFEIAGRVLGFLNTKPFRGHSTPDMALKRLVEVGSSVPQVTVVLLHSGKTPIHTLPSSDQLNRIYAETYQATQKSKKPFLTYLNFEKGQWTDATIVEGVAQLRHPPHANKMVSPGVVAPSLTSAIPSTHAPTNTPKPPIEDRQKAEPKKPVLTFIKPPVPVASPPPPLVPTPTPTAPPSPEVPVQKIAPVVEGAPTPVPPPPPVVLPLLPQAPTPPDPVIPARQVQRESLPVESLRSLASTSLQPPTETSEAQASPTPMAALGHPAIAPANVERIPLYMWAILLGLLLLILMGWLILKRSQRTPAGASLISRSMGPK